MNKIIILGTATIDIVLQSKEVKVHMGHEALNLGSKLEVERMGLYFGGGAMNVAVALKHWRLEPKVFVCLSRDEAGKIIARGLQEKKIDHCIFWRKGHSPLSVIILSPSGERTILVYRGVSGLFKKQELNYIAKQGELYYLSTGQMRVRHVKNFLISLKKARVVINPAKHFYSSGDLRKIFPFLSAIILNEEEFQYLRETNKLEWREILDFSSILSFIITAGNKGGFMIWQKRIYLFPSFPVKKIVDKTGAGDAFSAGFIYGFLQKEVNLENLRKSITYGSFNAAQVIQKEGAQQGIAKLVDLKKVKNLPLKEITIDELGNFLS